MEAYTWKITLPDDTVKIEGKDKFDLTWENAGAVKKIELIGKKVISYDFTTNTFVVDEKSIKPIIPKGVDRKLYFRKRRQVRTDGSKILAEPRTIYILGFEIDGKQIVATIKPSQGDMPEEITLPKSGAVPIKEE